MVTYMELKERIWTPILAAQNNAVNTDYLKEKLSTHGKIASVGYVMIDMKQFIT